MSFDPNKPFISFQDPKTGELFGMSKDLLACGLLAIGAPVISTYLILILRKKSSIL